MPSANHDDVERLYRSRPNSIRMISRHVGRDDASDVEQDAYVKLIEARRRQDIAAPIGFLHRIVRNLVIDRVRRTELTETLFEPLIEPAEYEADCVDEERRLIAADRLRLVLGLIDAMPARRREVFVLHRLDGLSYARIASALGISIKTVEKHMSAAMAQLADGMGGR